MNRADRRAFKKVKSPNTLDGNKVGEAMKQINHEILTFVRNIMDDCGVNSDTVYYKLELQDMCYKLLLCNSETGAIVGKAWALTEFLDLCSNKKIEFEINTVVRKLILKLDDKRVTNSDGATVPQWI